VKIARPQYKFCFWLYENSGRETHVWTAWKLRARGEKEEEGQGGWNED